MSNILPKEKQSAYQRWELASFDDEFSSLGNSANHSASANHSNEQTAATHERAHVEGYAKGLEEGRKTGIEEGLKTGFEEGHKTGFEEGRTVGLREGREQAAQEVEILKNLLVSFQSEISKADELIAQDMLDLALDIAKSMLQCALRVRPEIILPIITEAVRYLPSVQQPASLLLNPEDAPIVKQHIGDELAKAGWRISEDINIERGGCRVETASNQIDATASTRWQRINSALGKNTDWLAS